jgi:hypothetical protein
MLAKLLKDHYLYHTEFQQDNYITVKSGGTLYGQYRQSLRELYKRTRGLREVYCDREKLKIEIREQKKLSEKFFMTKIKKDYAKVEYHRKSMMMEEAERVIKHTEREFQRFYEQAMTYKHLLGDITEERRKVLEKEMHIFHVKEMAVIDYITSGRLRNSTYEFINSMPKQIKDELMNEIKGDATVIENLIKWYENVDNSIKIKKFPVNPKIELDEKCLLDI